MDPAAVSGRKPANLRSLCTLSPANPQAWNYVCDATDAALALDVVSERLLYVGHSHLTFICACTPSSKPRQIRSNSCVFYNVSATQQKILDAGLPRFLADRLNQGC